MATANKDSCGVSQTHKGCIMNEDKGCIMNEVLGHVPQLYTAGSTAVQ